MFEEMKNDSILELKAREQKVQPRKRVGDNVTRRRQQREVEEALVDIQPKQQHSTFSNV